VNAAAALRIERWTPVSIVATGAGIAVLVALALGPVVFGANTLDKLTELYVYVILAAMWNALAGYAGLVSVGQQAFFGLGAYAAVQLTNHGVNVWLALALAGLAAGAISLPTSFFVLWLRGGEFAIGMWVVAEVFHLLVNLDHSVGGVTGTSLIALSSYEAVDRRRYTYWLALACMAVLLAAVFLLLRSRLGASMRAIRDDERAAGSVGVRVLRTKLVVFVLAAVGSGAAGAVWLAGQLTFQPNSYFSVQWTAYMIFMALVGGLGTFEGPIIGAVIFFAIQNWFGEEGVWYLVGLGTAAVVFALLLPRGLWGTIEDRSGVRLLPVGYRVRGLGGGGGRVRSRSRTAGENEVAVPAVELRRET
jgi:branched-chain amino acid transport system permease protein